jgi:hemolysin D
MTLTAPAPKKSTFDPTIVLQQPKSWSRGILWGILGLAAFTVTWASVTEIEQAIPATGKLEPEGAVKDVQTPMSGVVTESFVHDGQKVKQGDVLLRFDTTTAKAQVESQEKIRAALVQEMRFYQAQLDGNAAAGGLGKSRATIAADNQLLQAQVQGDPGNLSAQQQLHLATRQSGLNARIDRANLDAAQTTQQLEEIDVQIRSAQRNRDVNQNILSRLQPLQKAGAIALLQVMKQEQEVMKYQAQIDQLQEQKQRIALDADKVQDDIQAAQAETMDTALSKISQNDQQIAEIDTQASRVILENQKKIAEIDAQLSQAKITLQYQELRAPVDGTVFELKAGTAGYVASPSVPVMKIVPSNNLIAKIDITNKDIGFVQPGMAADVRLDSFPFREFGGMQGELTWVGSDALLPDQLHQYYRFPAKIKINGQVIQANGKEIALQSGMSVSVNIKLAKRRVINIFLDEILKTTDSLKILR